MPLPSFRSFPAFCFALIAPLYMGIVAGLVAGCSGYHFVRTGEAEQLKKLGITRIYLAPIENETYKPGVDLVVYNEMLRALSSFGQVKIVQRADKADAVLRASVTNAEYGISASTFSSGLFPLGRGPEEISVATEYLAALRCEFTLAYLPGSGRGPQREVLFFEKPVWRTAFTRTKVFPANNQLGPFGTTSALINESEFDRTVRDMAESMMGDLHESMVAFF
jgi:hypothetical protein